MTVHHDFTTEDTEFTEGIQDFPCVLCGVDFYSCGKRNPVSKTLESRVSLVPLAVEKGPRTSH